MLGRLRAALYFCNYLCMLMFRGPRRGLYALPRREGFKPNPGS